MKHIFRIFFRDIGRITHNLVAIIVVGGVLFLPSLYAWFNIAANMDPYANTAGVKIAVANCDAGTEQELVGELHAGDKIIENLQENHSLGWTFVDRDEAIAGVQAGDYYAALVIPEDFSARMVSVLNGDIQQPEIEYYLNEKKNAIAPKVTDTGATTIQQQVNATFVEVASEAVAETLQETLQGAGADAGSAEGSILHELEKTQRELEEQQALLQNLLDGMDSHNVLFRDAADTLDQVTATAEQSAVAIDAAKDSLNSLRSYTNEFSTAATDSLLDAKRVMSDLNYEVSRDMATLNHDVTQLQNEVNSITADGRAVVERNEKLITELETYIKDLETKDPGAEVDPDTGEKIKDAIDDIQLPEDGNLPDKSQIEDAIHKLQQAESGVDYQKYLQELIPALRAWNRSFSSLLDNADSAAAKIWSVSNNIGTYHKNITDILTDGDRRLSAVERDFNENERKALEQSLDDIAYYGGELSATLHNLEPAMQEMQALLNQMEDAVHQTGDTLEQTAAMMERVSKGIGRIETDIYTLQSMQSVDKVEDWLHVHEVAADEAADFIAAPVTMSTVSQYPVQNYGSGMTPFYSVLAIWVSGIILVSLFKMELDRDEKRRLNQIKRLTAAESYIGRSMIFLAVGLLQAMIICAGDIWLLGVQCENIPLFFVAGAVTSVVFITLIYALASTWKHIGKAICVILLILQIPGSSGTFPIEMTPRFFQMLHPLLPFSYAITAFREAMFGMYGNLYWESLAILLIYVVIGLVIGLGIRPLLLNINRMIDRKLEESGLIVCEEEGMTVTRNRLKLVLSILAEQELVRDGMIQRAERFEKTYQMFAKWRLFLILIVPQIFMVIMFVVGSGAKMIFLILWIVSLFLFAFLLITVEYIHESLQEDLRLANLSQEELLRSVKEVR